MGPCPRCAHRFAHPNLTDARFGRILIAELAAWIFAVGANCGPRQMAAIARNAQSNDEANYLGIRSVNCERPVPSMNGRLTPLWHLCQPPIGTRALSWGLRGGMTRGSPRESGTVVGEHTQPRLHSCLATRSGAEVELHPMAL